MPHDNYVAIIGPPKTGTTWMHRYLTERTDAGVPRIKEFHWFDETDDQIWGERRAERVLIRKARVQKLADDMRRKLAETGGDPKPHHIERFDRAAMKTDADYRRFFEDRFAPDQTFVDVTPAYSRLSKKAYERMLAIFPKAKIVTFLRNPADHRWSRLAHTHRNQAAETDFADFTAAHLLPDEQKAAIRYQTIRAGLLEVFDPDRIMTIFTEDIFSERRAQTLAGLRDFMGIKETSPDPFDYTGNKGTYDTMTDSQRALLVQTFRDSYSFAEDLMGRLPPSWEQDRNRYLR